MAVTDLEQRLRACLSGDRHPRGQGKLNAAVVMALTDEAQPRLLLIRRTQALRLNPGEVAFPGGKAEPADGDLYTTALREAAEEVALPESAFRFCGSLPPRQTLGGLSVVAMVGLVPPALAPGGGRDGHSPAPLLRPDPSEVDALLWYPLALFAEPGRLRIDRFRHAGQERTVARYNIGPEMIWGMTAGYIVELVNRLWDTGFDSSIYRLTAVPGQAVLPGAER
jgi:8-oxo-dGTP pyrophosphatase MutT (NUDIX family)